MLTDLILYGAAFVLTPLFLIAPGYVLGWYTNILEFQKRRLITQLLSGMVLSVATTPTLVYLFSRFTSLDYIWLAFVPVWIVFFYRLYRGLRQGHLIYNKWIRLAFIFTCAWIIVAIFESIDLQIGNDVYFNVFAYDLRTRVALTDAIFRTGIPPINPHVYPGRPLEVSYFYLWSLIPALVTRLSAGLINARIAFIASSAWIGIALRGMAALYIRFLTPGGKQNPYPKAAAAVFLFFVTGLDIFFGFKLMFLDPGNPFITETWNGNYQVTSWTGATFMVPHHVAGLVAGLAGILLYQSMGIGDPIKKKITCCLITAISLVSMVGMSSYVAFIFIVFWGLYFLAAVLIKAWRRHAAWLALTGVLAILISVPYLYDLLSNREALSVGGGFLAFEVRPLSGIQWIFERYGFGIGLTNLANLFLLPIHYFIELGFFLIASLFYIHAIIKEKKVDQSTAVVSLLLFSSLFICSFFRSVVIINNDVGWRGFLPAQFVFLVWSTSLLVWLLPGWFGSNPTELHFKITPFSRAVISGVLLVGLCSMAFGILYDRFFFVLDDKLITQDRSGWMPKDIPARKWGERTYDMREAYCYIQQHYPLSAIVQINPELEFIVLTHGLYGMRQTATAGLDYAFIYGDNPEITQRLAAQVKPMYEDHAIQYTQVQQVCRQMDIDLLIVKDMDPIWKDTNSWVWKTSPVFSNALVRVYACSE